jgi:hypothetical protein
MREYVSRTSWRGIESPPSLKASAGNLRGSKAGLPTEAALAAKVGGARRNRTDDLLLAKQALSQLSYGPSRDQKSGIRRQDFSCYLSPDT